MHVFTCDRIATGSQLSGHVFPIRAVMRADLLCAGNHTENRGLFICQSHLIYQQGCYILTHMSRIKDTTHENSGGQSESRLSCSSNLV